MRDPHAYSAKYRPESISSSTICGAGPRILLEALATGFSPQATHKTRLVEVGRAPATPSPPGALLRKSISATRHGFGAASLDRIFPHSTLFSSPAGTLK